MEKILKQLGFHKNEVIVYLALFDLGKVRAKQIIETTNLHRNLVYTALDVLTNRNLVTKTMILGVAEFVANDPDSLVREQSEKTRLAEVLAVELRKKRDIEVREVEVTEGFDGIMRACNRLLDIDTEETGYVLGGSAFSRQPQLAKFWEDFHKKRIKKNQNFKILYDKTVSKEVIEQRNHMPGAEARYLPNGLEMPMWMYLSDDYCSICVAKDDPIIVNLRSKEITDAFKQYFSFLWNQKVSSATGYEAVSRAYDSMLEELNSGDEYFVLGANSGPATQSLHTLYESFHSRRVQKRVTVNMIASKNSYVDIANKFDLAGDKERVFSNLKKFPSIIEQPFQINLFKNKAMLYVYTDEPTVITFEDPEVYQGFKSYFDTLWNQESYVITGAEEVMNLWIKSIQTGELRLIGARGYFRDRFPDYFDTVMEQVEASENNVSWKIISDAGARDHSISQVPWAETRYVLPDVPSPNVVWLFGNTVAVANWTDHDPVVFVSTNPHLVQSYKDYFDAMWQQPEIG